MARTSGAGRQPSWLAEYLIGTHRALGFTQGPPTLGVLVHPCTKETEPGEPEVQGHPQLCSEFQDNLRNMKLYKIKKFTKNIHILKKYMFYTHICMTS